MAQNRPEIVLVDTNILFSQDKRNIVNSDFEDFLATYVNQFNLKLMIPDIVKGELKYQITHHLLVQLKQANNAVRVISSVTGKEYNHRITDERIKRDVNRKFESWLNKYKVQIIPTPTKIIKLDNLIDKSIWRKAPFIDSEKNEEKGFRDALILETILHFCKNNISNKTVSFLCNDRMLRDTTERQVGHSNFNCYETIKDFKSTLDLKKEKLELIFIKKITRRADEKFFQSGKPKCLYYRDNIRKAINDKYKEFIDKPELSINPELSNNQQGILSGITYNSLNQTLEAKDKGTYWIGRPSFEKVENQKVYYWLTVITYVKTYRETNRLLENSNLNLDIEKIHILPFHVYWKSEVSVDGKFLRYEYLDVELKNPEFRNVSEIDKSEWNLN